MSDGIKRGDIVEVIRIQQFGADIKIPAVVMQVFPDSFSAMALAGKNFGNEGEDMIMLQKTMKGKSWQ